MSIGYEESISSSHQQKQDNQEEQILQLSTEPLKIPLPKTGGNIKGPYTKSKSTSGTTPSTALSTGTGSTTAVNDKFLDTQIFSIDSASINKLGNLENEREKVDYSAFGTGYRAEVLDDKDEEASFCSGNVQEESDDFESDDGNSPFYSSDIDSDTSSEPPLLWNFADYFANLPGNDWCVRIPQCFIEDEFNLFELPDVFKCPLTLTDNNVEEERDIETEEGEGDEYTFDDLIDFITIEDLTEDPINKVSKEMLEDSVTLYKLIHQRFIMTKAGMQAMWERFDQQAFGTCPRYYCHDQPLLPLGPSALPNRDCAKVYCLNCQDVYVPFTVKHAKMDGVPFGPTFAHFFVRTVIYANEVKALENRKGPHDWQIYVPKIYGFRIHKSNEDNWGIRSERPRDFK